MANKNFSTNQRRIIFATLIYSFLSYGMMITAWPSLSQDLEFVHGVSQVEMGWAISVGMGFYGLSSLSSAILFKFCNRTLTLIASFVAMGFAFIAMPVFKGVAMGILSRIITGISGGSIDTIGNVRTLELWRGSSRSSRALQLLPFVSGGPGMGPTPWSRFLVGGCSPTK